MNRNEIVGAEDEMVFDETKWKWVTIGEVQKSTVGA